MASSPSSSPPPPRPASSVFQQTARSTSRTSMTSKQGEASRASDEDGKTSVKVAVRVRPPLRPTDPGFELIPQRFQRSMVHNLSPTSLAIDSPHGRKLFVFDRVFGEDVQQEGVWEYVDESVNAFVQGYNVSVLAYGQSGSGKSFTMGTSGPAEQSDLQLMGVIPRAAALLFNKLSGPPPLNRSGSSGLRTPTRYSMHSTQNLASIARSNAEKNWQMKATYVEIYNEQLRDLLVPEDTPQAERATVAIREDVRGRILLTGLHQVNINSIEDLLRALNFGSTIRQTDSTAINAKSSRSHAVFSINLVQRKSKGPTLAREKRFSMPVEAMSGIEDWVTVDSKLHFVDLAGSERLKNTGASGDRAKEGISINAGLASLGKVISQLSSRHSGNHISYRDSKLTRLLQDSLGGNAVTYMIACVTPAEFHLSETLNTVQYAQRARAIQSKPQIQQVSDDSDKQAVIDRLQAEVSFLRDQIRSSVQGNRMPQERSERHNEREMELQDSLLDVQENYTALSQRHAKLISEITKARDNQSGETPTLTEAIGDSAVERLKRSNSFAEAVEQVVLEYEKTIQSLEISLSNTRSSLANTESSLLEKENKCAYVDTINQQLQSRVQKLMDRESSNEQYLNNLEAKLDGQTSGGEKSTAVVAELRKEIARLRENELQCEDYISTLEERLAEADQDMELKQRELDRLEHVVERQRSLGKLDNLLYEFDHLHKGKSQEVKQPDNPLINGAAHTNESSSSKPRDESVVEDPADIPIPESDDEEEADIPIPESDDEDEADRTLGRPNGETQGHTEEMNHVRGLHPAGEMSNAPLRNYVQDRAVADKFEAVSQELFDLRIHHDSTVSEYDMMCAKYEEALRTLAEFQDAVDEARHPTATPSVASPESTRPVSFLGDARVNELKDGGHLSSSRSLSSELSSAGDSNTSLEPSVDESPHQKTSSRECKRISHREESLLQELEHLKKVQAKKDVETKALDGRFSDLQELHSETLDIVEELKTEVQKAKVNYPNAPSSPVIRRKSSQNVMTIDRAHRSLASLRNIAADNFEDSPDTMQNFELNLNTAMHELHQRSERVQLLEAELITMKKEVDSNKAMISGLTRERSSIKASSPMDISVVSTMSAQLAQTENQIEMLQKQHAVREGELSREVENLKHSLEQAETAKPSMPGFFPQTPATSLETDDKQLGNHLAPQQDVQRLEEEVSQWQGKHKAAVDSVHLSEKRLISTITDWEATLASVEAMRKEADAKARDFESRSAAASDFEEERANHARTVDVLHQEIQGHQFTIDSLKATSRDQADFEKEREDHARTMNALHDEIEGHKSMIGSHVERIARLEQLQDTAREQAEEAARFRSSNERQLESHQQQVSTLQGQIEERQSAIEFHKHGLKSLHDSHSRELEGLRSQIQDHATTKSNLERKLQDVEPRYTTHISRLEAEIIDLKSQQEKAKGGLVEEIQQSKASCIEMENQCDKLQKQLNALKTEMAAVATANEAGLAELEKTKAEKDRASSLVDQLEDQLSSSYDQQQANSNRLSVLNTTQLKAANEANMRIASLEKQLEASGQQIEQLHAQIREGQASIEHSASTASNLRKSASAASLPSPPPAIPLPPLPNGITNHTPTTPNFPTLITQPRESPQQQQADTDLIVQHNQHLEEKEAHIRQMEKHLFAEKQLTATLEEALVDLEAQSNKVKMDAKSFKEKCFGLEEELGGLRQERRTERYSVQAVEEERDKRREAERAREKLEERMKAVEGRKKKKGASLNCF